MMEWSTALRESYRRLQRAMARQRQQREQQLDQKASRRPSQASLSKLETSSISKRRSDATTPHAAAEAFAVFPDVAEDPNTGQAHEPDGQEPFDPNAPYDELPQEDPAQQTWSPEERRQWRREQWKKWKGDDGQSSTWPEDEDDLEPIKWEQFDYGNVQILPSELLGWLLLRRSGLPAAARLSVLSAISNQLDLDTVKRAMRDQEEELLLAEQHRARDHGNRRPRSFWVEQDHQWGLVNSQEDFEEVEENMIMWVGDRLPPELQPQFEKPATETAWTKS